MKIEKYQLKAESSLTTFEFISEGPKGLIRKRIEFQRTTYQRLFNLAFGDKILLKEEKDKYKIYFPKKLEQANEMLKTAKLLN